MSKEFEAQIAGTIIQRSFVAAELGTVLNVATVPLDELIDVDSAEDANLLRQLSSQIFAMPENLILDDQEYYRLARAVSAEGRLLYYQQHELGVLLERRFSEEVHVATFADHAIALISESLSDPWTSGFEARDRGQFIAGSLDISLEAFMAGLNCLSAGLSARPAVNEFAAAVKQYDVPLGHSPKTENDSLLTLIQSGKRMCLAPLAGATTIALGQLGQQAYAASLLTAGTGAGITLILIGTLSFSDYLIRRFRSGGSPLVGGRPPKPRRRDGQRRQAVAG
jgi:hypothetical protein